MSDLAYPTSHHAEMTILGGMMVEPVAIVDATMLLRTDDFALDSHRRIYATMLGLTELGHAVDIVTVSEELRRKKELDSVGGVAYLASLSEGLPRKLSIESYVRIVKGKSLARQIMTVCDGGIVDASDQAEPGKVLDGLMRRLSDLALEQDEVDLEPVSTIPDLNAEHPSDLAERFATKGGVLLGWEEFDRMTGGLQGGDLVIVAARPSMGKTAWACNAASATAVRSRLTTALFALEQSRTAMVRRMIAASARIEYRLIKSGELSSYDRGLFAERAAILREAPLYIADKSGMTVSRIGNKCRRLQAKTRLDIVFIDQLSKIAWDDVYQRGMQPREVVGRISGGLKRLAQELNVPVVVFNQLSRESAKRADNRPRLEDLKESGNLEEDADVVIFLHRPEYYDRSDPELKGKAEMIVAKQREGETGVCHCGFTGNIMRWED